MKRYTTLRTDVGLSNSMIKPAFRSIPGMMQLNTDNFGNFGRPEKQKAILTLFSTEL
jgi:hypothetical protein